MFASRVAALALIIAAMPASAQRVTTPMDEAAWRESCRSNGGSWGDDENGHASELRTFDIKSGGTGITVDGGANGSIRAAAWNGTGAKISACIRTQASSDSRAADLLKEVRISADGRTIRADGPSTGGWRNHDSWSVSYFVQVPSRYDLDLEASNGSLGVTGVSGRMDLRTVNGSVRLDDVSGDVRARTQNGSLSVQLAGNSWNGSGLDAETQNGSVRLYIPEKYAAQIETGTVNGRINTDFPITVQGRIDRRLRLPLNGGGKTIRAMTTNGSVTLSQRD